MTLPNLVLLLFLFAYIFGELRSIFAKVIGNKIMTRFGPKYLTPTPYQNEQTKNEERLVWIKRQFVW